MERSTLPLGRRILTHVTVALLLTSASVSSAQTDSATNAAVYAWGDNTSGQLGSNAGYYSAVPAAVSNLTGGVIAVAAGNSHSLAVQNGAAYAWGDDASGQLGNGAAGAGSGVPVQVKGLYNGVTAVAAGNRHSLAVRNGTVYAWGANSAGELGNGSTIDSAYPGAVNGLSSVSAVAAGNFHSLALQGNAVYAWGENGSGELGNGMQGIGANSSVPVSVVGLSGGVTAIAAGTSHSLAIRNGAVYTWGGNDNGQLGNGTSGITANSDVPVAVSGLSSGVTTIAGGSLHSLAVQNGLVFAWGGNGDGQLGNGTTTDSSVPVAVDPADLTNITAVAAGIASSYALSADGSLWVWGNNDIGELGLGDTASHLTPQHLLPPAGYRYTAITTPSGGDHAVAILAPVIRRFFDGEVALSNGVYYLAFESGNYFGYYSYLADPKYIYHFDLGYEYFFDAADNKAGVYFYDFKSSTFFYTSPTFPFPYLYDFALNTVLYYYPDPKNAGRYNTNGVRYFYNFATGQIITK